MDATGFDLWVNYVLILFHLNNNAPGLGLPVGGIGLWWGICLPGFFI